MVRSETRLRGSSNEVIIGWERPAVIISQLVPAHGKGGLADRFRRMDFAAIAQGAAVQVRSGADVLEMHIEDPALDEATCLPAMVKAVAQTVAVPLCVGARDPKALAAALAACPGKPLAYLIDQGTGPWRDFLAVAAQRGAAVIAQAVEPDGVPATVEERIETARRLLRECISAGIPRDDVIIDPVALPVANQETAAADVLQLAAFLARIDAVNMTLRVGAICHGLPDSEALDGMVIAQALAAGVTCPMVEDAAVALRFVLMGDVLLGRKGALNRYMDCAREADSLAFGVLAH